MQIPSRPNILVLGASGFVGSHILETLSQQAGVRLIAACRDRAKLPAEFSGEIRTGDVRDSHYLSRLFQDVDIVCNAFAWTSAWGHQAQSSELFLKPSLALIDAASACCRCCCHA